MVSKRPIWMASSTLVPHGVGAGDEDGVGVAAELEEAAEESAAADDFRAARRGR